MSGVLLRVPTGSCNVSWFSLGSQHYLATATVLALGGVALNDQDIRFACLNCDVYCIRKEWCKEKTVRVCLLHVWGQALDR